MSHPRRYDPASLGDMSGAISTQDVPPSYSAIDIHEHAGLEEDNDEYSITSVMEGTERLEAAFASLAGTSSAETLVEPPRATSSSRIPNRDILSQRNRNDPTAGEIRGPFTFSPYGTNAMLLLPDTLSPNSRPLYHISISNDCFRPHLYITTIRRGGSDQGEIVAEIKRPGCEHAKYKGSVQIGRQFAELEDVHFHKGGSDAVQQRFDWHFGDKFLKWETSHSKGKVVSVQCTQARVKNAPILAIFRPNRRGGNLQKLEISLEGQPFMDDIVISCLVTEARRTTKHDK